MRIAYLTSRSAPHREPDVQQMLHTASGLRKQGIEIDVLLPRRWSQLLSHADHLRASIGSHYGIAGELLPLVPMLPTAYLPAALVGACQLVSPRIAKQADLWSTMVADAGALGPALVRLKRGGYQMAYSRRWPLAAAATRLGIPTVYETYTAVSSGLLWKYSDRSHLAGIVVHSKWAAKALVSQGFPEHQIFVCYNGYSPEDAKPRLGKAEARSALGLPLTAQIACYAGRTKEDKAPELIVSLAARTPEVLYIIVGVTGFESRQLNASCGHLRVTNVRLVPWVQATALSAYLYSADVLLIPPGCRPLDSGHTVLPMKTFLYLATGRPILAPRLPDMEEVLEDGRNAILVRPDELDGCADRLLSLLGDAELQERIGTTAMQDSASFTWEARARRLAEFLRRFEFQGSNWSVPPQDRGIG